MKTHSLLSILICFFSTTSFAQWSSDPHFNNELILDIQLTNTQHVTVCGSMGVSRSVDGGTSWVTSTQFLPPAEGGTMEDLWFSSSIFYDVHFTDQQTGYAAGWSLINSCEIIIATTDGGDTWRVAYRGAANPSDPTIGITSLQFPSALVGYATSFNGRLIKTTDGGTTWNLINTGIAGDIKAVQFFDANTGTAISGQNLYNTTNGGQTWLSKSVGETAQAHFFINSQVGFISTENHMLKTVDGGTTWSALNMAMNVSKIHFVDSQVGYAAGNGIYKTADGGQIWTLQKTNISGFTALHFLNQNIGMAAGWDGETFRTLNGGGSTIPDVTISDFTPTQGLTGTGVTINGQNLDYVHKVVIGDVTVPFRVQDGKIYATVPAGITDEKTISISSLSETVYSGQKFSLIKTPYLSSFTPTYAVEGASITISGINFTTASAVLFNNKPASFSISNDNTIIASVPTGNASGQIEVITNFGRSTSYSYFTKYATPVITSIEPAGGYRESHIILHGINLEPGAVVKLNGVTVPHWSKSETEFVVLGLPANATSGKFSVQNPATVSFSADEFTIVEGSPSTSITSISPDSGPGGELVTITGTDFYSLKKLYLNGTEVPFEIQSSTQLVAEIPIFTESGIIEGLNWNGESISSVATPFTVLPGQPVPSIHVMTPSEATIQSRIILEGKNLAYVGEIFFNGERAPYAYRQGLTKIVTEVPVHAETGFISANEVNSDDVFTVIPNYCVQQRVLDINFYVQSLAVGNIFYENTNASDCKTYFDKTDRIVEATPGLTLSLNSSTLRCGETYPVNELNHYVFVDWNNDQDFLDEGELVFHPETPRHSRPQYDEFQLPENSPISGTYRMRLFISSIFYFEENLTPCYAADRQGVSIDMTLKMVNDLTFGQPQFTAFHPARTTFGATLSIEGEALESTQRVTIDKKTAAFQYNSVTGYLDVIVPAQSTGTDVVVITQGGSVHIKNELTVIPPPLLYEITPLADTVGGKIKWRLPEGSASSITHVYFNGTEANFYEDSPFFVAEIPAGATSGKIELVNEFSSYYSQNDFTVITAPSVDTFFPTSGKMGEFILITGSDFIEITNVLFNGKPSRFTVVSKTQISAQVPYGGSHGAVSVVNKKATATSAALFTVLPDGGNNTFREIPAFNFNKMRIGTDGYSFDYNHDGYQDLLLSAVLPEASLPDEYNIVMYESFYIYKSNGDGSFAETSIRLEGYGFAKIGDFNGDGFDDVVTEYPGGFKIHYNDANHQFDSASYYIRMLPLDYNRWWNHEVPRLTEVMDFDHDGDLDIVVTGSSVAWLEQIDGSFTLRYIELPSGQYSYPYSFADLDKDGDTDMISGYRVYKATNGTYTLQTTLNPAYDFRTFSIVDFNSDGFPDILASAWVYPGDYYQLYKNVNGLGFERVQHFGDEIPVYKTENWGDLYNTGATGMLSIWWPQIYYEPFQQKFELTYFDLPPTTGPAVVRESMPFSAHNTPGDIGSLFGTPAFLLDFDNDRDLDLFMTQSGTRQWPRIFKNYSNEKSNSNADPSPPTLLAVTKLSDTEVMLSWNTGADDHTSVASLNYNVVVKDETTGKLKMVPLPQGSPYGNAGMNTNFHLKGIDPSHIYSFRVKTVDQGYRSSEPSVEKKFRLQSLPVAQLTVTPTGSRSVRLDWTDNSNAEDGFVIEYKKQDQSSYEILANVGSNVTALTDTLIDCHGAYSFRIRSFNAYTLSEYSAEVVATTLPVALLNISGNTSFCQGDSTKLTSSPGFAEYTWNTGNRLSFLYASATGAYTVAAKDSQGCETNASITVNELTLPVSTVVNADGHLIASGAISYEWFRNGQPILASGPQLTPEISGLYKVKATNALGCIAFSNEISFSISEVVTPDNLLAPDNLVANSTGTRTVVLAWTDNSSDEDGFVIEYKIQEEAIFKTLASVAKNSQQYFAKDLECTTQYQFRIRAYKQNLYSDFSETATAKTIAIVAPEITGVDFACEGSSVSLSASSGYANYEWSNGSKTQTVVLTTSGKYSVQVKDAEGCEASSEKTIQIRPLPQPSLEFRDGQLVASGGSFYEWFWNDKIQAHEGGTFSPEMPGDYSVKVSEGECSAFSDIVTIVITDLDYSANADVKIAPNPGSGIFTVFGTNSESALRIINAFGKEVAFKTISKSDDQITIDLTTEVSSVYFISIRLHDRTRHVRVILLK